MLKKFLSVLKKSYNCFDISWKKAVLNITKVSLKQCDTKLGRQLPCSISGWSYYQRVRLHPIPLIPLTHSHL